MSSISCLIQLVNTIRVPLTSTPFFSSKLICLQSTTARRSYTPRVSDNLPPLSPSCSSSSVEECDDDASEYQVLTAIRSSFNDIVILETPQSRLLLLDSTHTVHSVFNKGNKWTGSCWLDGIVYGEMKPGEVATEIARKIAFLDQFASLPPIVPKGTIAIFGLGGGTAAHLLLEVWPSLQLDGWEIDEVLIYKSRDYLGLADLEKQTEAGGRLNVIVGDALSSSATIPGGYAGIIVDLFSEGKVLPQMQEVEYWLGLQLRLMPNGRIMINCGGNDANSVDETTNTWESNSTIRALCKAFPTQLSWMKLPKDKGANYLALTGPLPDLTLWSDALPDILRSELQQWKSCSPS